MTMSSKTPLSGHNLSRKVYEDGAKSTSVDSDSKRVESVCWLVSGRRGQWCYFRLSTAESSESRLVTNNAFNGSAKKIERVAASSSFPVPERPFSLFPKYTSVN